MPTPGQRPSSSSRDLTLVVESESGTPEEFFAQVALSIGRATSNTIHINHPDVDHIHAKVVKREESFWLRCEGQAKLQLMEPDPGEVGEVELVSGLTIELGGVIIRCRRQLRGMGSLSDDYWADAAGGERFRVETDSFKGNLPKKIGPYEIRKFVARGGMGVVLQGLHQETAHLAAVKLPTPDLNKDHQWLKRFELEVRTLKSVTHPNLVRLQDTGQEGELHWMAMDWVEGWTVAERLAVYKEAGEPMPLSEIQLVLKQVVEGLTVLHSKGVVHRDLKPGNLLVGQDGAVKVADFGLAKQVGGEQSTFLTRTGTFAGTMHYMAPEQAEGTDITPATDIYALGVIWYELLTSRRPASGRLKLSKFRPDCPTNWGGLLEDCLDVEASDRPSLSRIQKALQAESFEAVVCPTGPEREETPPVGEIETEEEQWLGEGLGPGRVIEAEAPVEIEEESEPVAVDTGYTSYAPEPVRKTGVKVKNWLVLATIVIWGLVVYSLFLKGDGEIPVETVAEGPALPTPKSVTLQPPPKPPPKPKSPPLKTPDPGIDSTAPDANLALASVGLGSNFQPGPTPPPMVQDRDFEYSLGKLEIRTYGTELPKDEQDYLRTKADELITQFENYTGVKPPKGFFYQVYYYKDKRQFEKVTGKDPNKGGGFTFWNSASRDKIAPIHCHGGFHTLLHEMVHAITWPAYGRTPLFMTEGFAEWLAFMFLFNPDHKTRSNLFSQVKVLANRIRADALPSLDKFLKAQNYGHWQRDFGQIGLGYGASNLLVDFLLVNSPDWTKKALAHCRQAGPDQLRRSKAFHKYVQDNWPGGLAGLDMSWRAWILHKEKALATQQ